MGSFQHQHSTFSDRQAHINHFALTNFEETNSSFSDRQTHVSHYIDQFLEYFPAFAKCVLLVLQLF